MTRALRFWLGLAVVLACFALSEGCESRPFYATPSQVSALVRERNALRDSLAQCRWAAHELAHADTFYHCVVYGRIK